MISDKIDAGNVSVYVGTMPAESALSSIKSVIGKSGTALIAAHIVYNLARGVLGALGMTTSRSGSRHAGISDPEKSIGYINAVFADYLAYGGLAPADISGKSVLEVGPGDNFGVAILFLLHGAKRVVCYDRYYSRRDLAAQKAVYLKLRTSLPIAMQHLFDALISWRGDEPVIAADRFAYVYGEGIENADHRLSDAAFDLIISRSVMEHVADVPAAFAAMDRVLKPGGLMAHKIDLRDHGLFSAHGGHPLRFLTVPETVYRAMVKWSGRPNRFMAPEYVKLLSGSSYDTTVYVTHTLDDRELCPHLRWLPGTVRISGKTAGELAELRARLAPRFRDFTDAELAVTGIFVTGRKMA